MRRGTTDTLTIKVNAEDLTDSTIYATMEQDNYIVTKKNPPVTYEDDVSTVTVSMTQAESLKFNPGTMRVQLAWIYADGSTKRSTIESVSVENCLLNEEIEYDE